MMMTHTHLYGGQLAAAAADALIATCTDRAINYPLYPIILLVHYCLTGVVVEPQHFGVRPYAVLSDRLGEP